MNTFWRILQLVVLTIVFFLVSGTTMYFIKQWDGGLLDRWRRAPFTGSIGEESIAIELAAMPFVFGVLSCWCVVWLFRLRSVHNEVEDTFKPMLMVAAGYGRFVLIVVAGLYLVLGHGWAAAAHMAGAILAFSFFYLTHQAKEQAMKRHHLNEQEEEGEDDSDKAA
ncbi:MAG: hypothetical protein RLZZ265_510 [Verrucomicrobiota bacterium]|jgi:hypothetical protein